MRAIFFVECLHSKLTKNQLRQFSDFQDIYFIGIFMHILHEFMNKLNNYKENYMKSNNSLIHLIYGIGHIKILTVKVRKLHNIYAYTLRKKTYAENCLSSFLVQF